MGVFWGSSVGFFLGHSNLTKPLFIFSMLPTRAAGHSQALDSLQSLLSADVVRQGQKLSEWICCLSLIRKKSSATPSWNASF